MFIQMPLKILLCTIRGGGKYFLKADMSLRNRMQIMSPCLDKIRLI